MFRSLQKFFEAPHFQKQLLNKRTMSIPEIFPLKEQFSSHSNSMKVTVIGAAGKIGQPLCLMLKQSPLIDELCVHDVVSTGAFASELNYVDTNCRVTSVTGKENLANALKNSKVVVVLAAAPDADLMPQEKMWPLNGEIVRDIVHHFGRISPKAFLAIATNPVNSTVPLACEVLKKIGQFHQNAIFGITTLNTVRANTFVAKTQGLEPECVVVPVIGGNTEQTIVPVLSQAKPCAEFTNDELETITTNIRKAQENILKLKTPETGPLCGAFACARFVISLVKAIRGYPDIIECAYVPSKVHSQLKYLATPLNLGLNGVMRNLGIPKLTEFESCMFDNAVPILTNDIKRGEQFAGVASFTCAQANPPEGYKCPRNWCDIEKEGRL